MEGDNFSGSLHSLIARNENASVALQKVFNHCPSGRARRSQTPTRLGPKATNLKRHHNPHVLGMTGGSRFGLRLESAGSFEPPHSEEAEGLFDAHLHAQWVLRPRSAQVPPDPLQVDFTSGPFSAIRLFYSCFFLFLMLPVFCAHVLFFFFL